MGFLKSCLFIVFKLLQNPIGCAYHFKTKKNTCATIFPAAFFTFPLRKKLAKMIWAKRAGKAKKVIIWPF